MINTVLGSICVEELGVTLMHEHIVWDWSGADQSKPETFDADSIINRVMPYLLSLKESGCNTLVEATTRGAGRHVEILKECSRRSGLNIITNTGAWDGGNRNGFFVPEHIRQKDIDSIAYEWIREYRDGIEGSNIKPGYIKIAIGDTDDLTELNEKLLRAAVRTSLKTGLTIQCHTVSYISIDRIINIIEEEKLPYSKLIWVHSDAKQNSEKIIEVAKKGIWIELDTIQRVKKLDWHIKMLETLIENDLVHRVLISQDAGTVDLGLKDENRPFYPYDELFKETIPVFNQNGIEEEVFRKILVDNPAKVLNIINIC